MTARSIYSATTGLGLFAFLIIAAFAFGLEAGPTQLAFGLLAVYGTVEIALLSYTPRRPAVRAPRLGVPSSVVRVTATTASRSGGVRMPVPQARAA